MRRKDQKKNLYKKILFLVLYVLIFEIWAKFNFQSTPATGHFDRLARGLCPSFRSTDVLNPIVKIPCVFSDKTLAKKHFSSDKHLMNTCVLYPEFVLFINLLLT